MIIRTARSDEAPQLTAVAIEAKRYWGYPQHWLEAWVDTLTVTPEYIGRHSVQVVELGGRIAGFNGIQIFGDTAVLDHLWVLPEFMGRGIGRKLFLQAEAAARIGGTKLLKITADPHAEEFYQKMGAVTSGREPASLDERERYLPLMEKSLLPP